MVLRIMVVDFSSIQRDEESCKRRFSSFKSFKVKLFRVNCCSIDDKGSSLRAYVLSFPAQVGQIDEITAVFLEEAHERVDIDHVFQLEQRRKNLNDQTRTRLEAV